MSISTTLLSGGPLLRVTILCAAVALLSTISEAAAHSLPHTAGVPVCIVGAQSLTVGTTHTPLEEAAQAALLCVPGVDGAYLQASEEDDGIVINVLSREHGIVRRAALFEIEERLSQAFGTAVTFVVRAHQGRDMRAMAGADLLFARG